ncbi:MAG: hypothetical protein PUA73_01550 [Bacilli bacterium]|nr:hypothetical protein [Bacilli bacterium]
MIYFYISLSTYICFNILKYKETLKDLKENNYNIKKYTKYIVTNLKKLFLTPEILSLIIIVLAFKTNLKVIGVSTVTIYTILFLLNYKKKNKLKLDSKIITRIILIIVMYISLNIYFIKDYMSYHYADIIFDNTPFYYIILVCISYLSPVVVELINIISKPIDKLVKRKE